LRFLIDEGLDIRIGRFLARLGHEVVFVAGGQMSGLGDEEVLAAARADNRVLLTEDLDFGELVFRRNLPHTGVMVLRLEGADVSQKTDLITQVLRDYEDRLEGAFSVITERAVRIRRPVSG
jgi:predicted nuclease of predicted toxin-antitoxin system